MAEQTFTVGETVRVLAGGEGVVTYGPFNSTFDTYTMYVVKRDGDSERAFMSVDLEPLRKFAVGDKVLCGTVPAELIAGPVTGAASGEDVFLYKYLDGPDAGTGGGKVASAFEPLPEPALIPVGTRVRVDRATYASEHHGRVGTVMSNTATFRREHDDVHVYTVKLTDDNHIYAAEVTPVDDKPDDTFEYEGVTYEYGVTYLDDDGDPWTFKRSPIHGQPVSNETSAFINEPLGAVVREYGPLTKQ